ncbi:hypothetical protein L1887_05598 [Cichorium endivia]|nr:hypothetical protein L1887_05598 [Cichorium endivia]
MFAPSPSNSLSYATTIASHPPISTPHVHVHDSEAVTVRAPGPSNVGFTLVTKKKSKPNPHNKQNFKMSKNPANNNPSQLNGPSGQNRNSSKEIGHNIKRPTPLPSAMVGNNCNPMLTGNSLGSGNPPSFRSSKTHLISPVATSRRNSMLMEGRKQSSSIYDVNMNDLNGSNSSSPPSESSLAPAISTCLTYSTNFSILDPSCEDEPMNSQLQGRLATTPLLHLNE